MPGKSHEQRSLLGYSPWGLKRIRHDLAAKQQLQVYCILINLQSSCQIGDTFSHVISNILEYELFHLLDRLGHSQSCQCSYFNNYGFNWNLFYVGHLFSCTHWLVNTNLFNTDIFRFQFFLYQFWQDIFQKCLFYWKCQNCHEFIYNFYYSLII